MHLRGFFITISQKALEGGGLMVKVGDVIELGGKKWRVSKLILDYVDPMGEMRSVYTDVGGETFDDLKKWLIEEYRGFHGEMDILGRRIELKEGEV